MSCVLNACMGVCEISLSRGFSSALGSLLFVLRRGWASALLPLRIVLHLGCTFVLWLRRIVLRVCMSVREISLSRKPVSSRPRRIVLCLACSPSARYPSLSHHLLGGHGASAWVLRDRMDVCEISLSRVLSSARPWRIVCVMSACKGASETSSSR